MARQSGKECVDQVCACIMKKKKETELQGVEMPVTEVLVS